MNAGATTGRVQNAIRQMILTRGVRPGERLDPVMLADRLATSATPVREALNQLCGAGLVDARPGGGFHVPMIDAPALADLYRWNEDVIAIILRSAKGRLSGGLTEPGPAVDTATATAALTMRLAQASRNEEHQRAIRDINARLHAVRLVEAVLMADTIDELARLSAAADLQNISLLRKGWRRYHRRRQPMVAEIVRSLLRD